MFILTKTLYKICLTITNGSSPDDAITYPRYLQVKKTTRSNHKEVALGKVAYSQGIHAFEFTWAPASGKHVAIGIASENIKVHSESGALKGSEMNVLC